MITTSVLTEINEIIASERLNEEQKAITISQVISKLEIGKQIELHSLISETALKLLIHHKDKLVVVNEVKEEYVWWYYREKIYKSGNYVDSNLLNELFQEYANSNSIGLESVVIQLIKSDILTEEQLVLAERFFNSKIFEKESFAYTIRKKINSSSMLDVEDVNRLLDFRLYFVLEKALDNNLVPVEGVDYITSPSEGSPDRKIRLRLFHKAQLIRNSL